MRRTAVFALVLSCAAALGSGVARAESETVRGDSPGPGTGDITKMVADNGVDAVTAKVFGIGRPCTEAKDLSVYVENRRGRILYHAQAVCSAGTSWSANLYYTATGSIQDEKRVRCSTFTFARSKATGAYKVVMPRRCLGNAPGAVRLEAEGSNWGSVTGGHAGPTSVLSRG
jgi:hypothetical protein